MAGHSKWANIKHKKAATDKKRGKAFTRLSKEISVAARASGGDQSGNPRLRQLVEKARDINMPMDTITRAIKKGTGELPGLHYEAQMYEGYGPHGIAVIVETLTDNKNRNVADMRKTFSLGGGNLAEGGAVSWMFKKLGVVRAEGEGFTEDKLLEQLIEFDVKDITCDKNLCVITCGAKSLDTIKQELANAGLNVTSAELEWVSGTPAPLEDSQAEKALIFLDQLEELEDVQNVYTNLA